jgi:hypothetical protein
LKDAHAEEERKRTSRLTPPGVEEEVVVGVVVGCDLVVPFVKVPLVKLPTMDPLISSLFVCVVVELECILMHLSFSLSKVIVTLLTSQVMALWRLLFRVKVLPDIVRVRLRVRGKVEGLPRERLWRAEGEELVVVLEVLEVVDSTVRVWFCVWFFVLDVFVDADD